MGIHQAGEAVIIFDDISWSSGMQKAWTEIENDDRVAVTIDLRIMGIAVISNTESVKGSFSIPLS